MSSPTPGRFPPSTAAAAPQTPKFPAIARHRNHYFEILTHEHGATRHGWVLVRWPRKGGWGFHSRSGYQSFLRNCIASTSRCCKAHPPLEQSYTVNERTIAPFLRSGAHIATSWERFGHSLAQQADFVKHLSKIMALLRYCCLVGVWTPQ